jgi:hypothetical protein
VTDILEKFLIHSHGALRKLILQNCWFGLDSTGLIVNIVDLYPDLEFLLVERCHPISDADYSLISHLKKLSELKLSAMQVGCMYVKNLGTHVCICECI